MLSGKVEPHLASIGALLEDEGVILAYLFGSAAKGLERRDSDLDFAVLFGDRADPGHYGEVQVRLLTGLIGITHTNDVDLVILNTAPPLLAFEVISTGILLLGSHADRVRFEIGAIRRAIDTRPIRKLIGEGILRRIRTRSEAPRESAGKW